MKVFCLKNIYSGEGSAKEWYVVTTYATSPRISWKVIQICSKSFKTTAQISRCEERVITFLQADEQAVHHEGQLVEGDVEAHACLALPHAC